jgi:hypothetical protein
VKIFERKLGPIELTPVVAAVAGGARVLCGSSWQSDLELRAIDAARAAGKPSAVFLDHWVNYAERFTRDGLAHLPDEIWVGDAYAERIARHVFPALPLHYIANPYFEQVAAEFAAIDMKRRVDDSALRVLYVCEPIRDHALAQQGDAGYWGYTEESALRYFLSNVSSLGRPIAGITLRPHPSEAADKYDWAKREFDLPIVQGGAQPLTREIAGSDWVVGCESMALVAALIAGKRVISSIPPGGRACVLPHAEIEHLQVLVAGASMSS